MANNPPRTIDEIFNDFKGRRAALIKALTTDFDDFYKQCDPEKKNLCLYGFPNEQWEVNLPAEDVPSELPEPALGINFARDGMQIKGWLALVAVHSDAWLLSVAFYFGARFGFDKTKRKRFFDMVNELPTIFEVVANSSNKSGNKEDSKATPEEEEGLEEDQEEEADENVVEACEVADVSNETWVCCDICEKWSHAKCAKITPAIAEDIKQCKCSCCSNNSAPYKEDPIYQALLQQQRRTISCWKVFKKCLFD